MYEKYKRNISYDTRNLILCRISIIISLTLRGKIVRYIQNRRNSVKRLFLIVTTILLTVCSSVFAQTNSVSITGGRFFMQRGTQNLSNALIETPNFTALSWVNDNGGNSVWDICSISSNPAFCKIGTSFRVPNFPKVEVGFCSACSPPQFPRGTFTINGTTYENVYFGGQFQFSQATFPVSPAFLAKRKGFVRFRKPFTLTGNLQVCRTVNEFGCPNENILFSNQINGRGTLTVTMKIVVDEQISPRPFLVRESIDYQFEK